MNDLEDFHIDLYHAKIKFIGIKAGRQEPPWDTETQRNIDALYGLCNMADEIEAHIIAARTYFSDKISYSQILQAIKQCCKSHVHGEEFTFAFFNRLLIQNP